MTHGSLRRWLCLGLVLASLTSACAGPDKARGLEVRDARAVLIPPTGAVYLTIVNPGPQSDRLLRIETTAAQKTMIHESREENGVMRMVEHPDGFEVPAGGTLVFQPGGKHIMLMNAQAPAAGATIPLTLHFERAGAVAVQAAVAKQP